MRRLIPLLLLLTACTSGPGSEPDWPMFRFNMIRGGAQPLGKQITPAQASTLHQTAEDNLGLTSAFHAAPIVYGTMLYVGNSDGHLYALDRMTLKKVWQYPPAGQPALVSKFESCYGLLGSSFGIASSAAYSKVRDPETNAWRPAVIFAAPDPEPAPGFGSGVIFAVDPKDGTLIRKSPVLARLTGLTPGNKPPEYHEKLGYSAPLVATGRIYVGVSDHCDNPVQKGRVVALDQATLQIADDFQFCAVGNCWDYTIGGGVWSSLSYFQGALYVTTGNVRNSGDPEPSPNHGLSLLRLDWKSGKILGKFQPVPWELDDDPDWAAGAVVAPNVCADGNEVILSTQKDGYSYALNVGEDGKLYQRWVFPPAKTPFVLGDGTVHVDTQYKRAGAVYGKVYVTATAGWNAGGGNLRAGYTRLHAFNICATDTNSRIRWILDVPGMSADCTGLDAWYGAELYEAYGRNCMGPPSISWPMVFVGTQGGHLVGAADPEATGLAEGTRCNIPELNSDLCEAFGFGLIPVPKVMIDLDLHAGAILTEPVVTGGSVYVSTVGGRVLRLEVVQ